MNCRGCGTAVDHEPTTDMVNQAVDEVLEASLRDAQEHGGVCPLCGHSKALRFYQRDSFRTSLLLGVWLLLGLILGLTYYYRSPIRSSLAQDAVRRARQDERVKAALGEPVTIGLLVKGGITQDETGWSEAKLDIPLTGPKARGILRVAAGQGTGPWVISTLEVWVEQAVEPINLLRGRVEVTSDRDYVSVHAQATVSPEFIDAVAPPPEEDGSFPVFRISLEALAGAGSPLKEAFTSRKVSVSSLTPENVLEVDLRSGKFVVHRTDIFVPDSIPLSLTRSYYNFGQNVPLASGAFGAGATHNYDICPFGTRNPYTYMQVYVGDGNYLHFNRISKGTSYADAVYEHTRTSEFYKARLWWSGGGWTLRLPNGTSYQLPDSYYGKTLAQGAPFEMRDPEGRRVQYVRDGQRNLRRLISPNGRTISLETNKAGRIVEAHDDGGHHIAYTYDSAERLIEVHDNGTPVVGYSYTDDNMAAVLDGSGHILLQNRYEDGRISEQILPDGRTYRFEYALARGGNALAVQTVVTLPDLRRMTLNFRDGVLTSQSVSAPAASFVNTR